MEGSDSTANREIAISRISQDLKRVMRESPNWDVLYDIQSEALDVIAMCIAQILGGDKPDDGEVWKIIHTAATKAMALNDAAFLDLAERIMGESGSD